MRFASFVWLGLGSVVASLAAESADNLVFDGVPAAPAELRRQVSPYLEFRHALFQDWHPTRREVIVTTRFADSLQLHAVAQPGGARRQLTFLPEPVSGAVYQPTHGSFLIFSQDSGGGEFFQFYRLDLADGKITLLTDGKSRNTGARWSNDGRRLAYTSTRRNGRDNDVYVMDPAQPATDRRVAELTGGGWSVADWSPDDRRLLLRQYVSINESYLYLLDAESGQFEPLTPRGEAKVSFQHARFAKDGRSVFVATDKDSEFQRLARLDLATRAITPLTTHISWDVAELEVSPDGNLIAFLTNEDGLSVLHLMQAKSGREVRAPRLPGGVAAGLKWRAKSRELAFNLTSARSPYDAYSVDVKSGKLERWTASETGGLNAAEFIEPELVRIKSFDGLPISGFLYQPDAKKFPGSRPLLVNIHGGPEGQSRPVFQARNNFFLNELGVAILYPNVRGSDGYGKTFLTLDNGFKREDSVKDIGAWLDWVPTHARLDAGRVAVYGGSYGGYMVLASLTHYSARLRAGVDVVGISNFLSFLKNTQDYRRDLRRVEYGDERDAAMAAFLEKISPLTRVSDIQRPLFVVQGQNDPRVPASESEQMVRALRAQGGSAWYLLARDEGHGFQKKKNVDAMFLAIIQFLREQLVTPAVAPSAVK